MELKWLGHSCFRLTHEGWSVVIDPFEPGSVPGLRDIAETADAVLCSHGHHDHNYTAAVTIREHEGESPFLVDSIGTFHDPERGKLRGKNTIHIFTAGDRRVAHLGDLGCELKAMQKVMLRGLDALLCPVGGFYTIDAAQARALLEELQPKAFIPMHYRTERFGFDVIGTLDDFLALCPPEQVVRVKSDTLSLDGDLGGKVYVLEYPEG